MKKRLLFGFGVAAVVVLRGLGHAINVRHERDDLRNQLSEVRDLYNQVPAATRRRVETQGQMPYRLPIGAEITVATAIGDVRLLAMGGYFSGTAIFVYLPEGYEITRNLSLAFNEMTDNEFHLEHAPGSSSGGDNAASAIITAGRDYLAYTRGEQGYFKESPAPHLAETADLLFRLIMVHGESMVVVSE